MACKNMPEKGFKMHRSLQIYIERTYGKTESIILGGNPRDGAAAFMGPLSPFIAELRYELYEKKRSRGQWSHIVSWVTDA